MVADAVARHAGCRFDKRKADYHSAEIIRGQVQIRLIKPQTYMNRSGRALKPFINSVDGDLSRLMVICDDINLGIGTIRLRPKGSHGGHRGLESVIQEIGSEHFPRMRIGVGMPDREVVNFVLSPFKWNERLQVRKAVENAKEAVFTFVDEGIDRAMNRVNKQS